MAMTCCCRHMGRKTGASLPRWVVVGAIEALPARRRAGIRAHPSLQMLVPPRQGRAAMPGLYPWPAMCLSCFHLTLPPLLLQSLGSGRNGKSCRLRWFNQLDPTLKKEPFTPQEVRGMPAVCTSGTNLVAALLCTLDRLLGVQVQVQAQAGSAAPGPGRSLLP
jgi:hypothetical protein